MSDRDPITFTATIMFDGTITLTTNDPNDFERAWEHMVSIMIAIAGDKPIGYTGCLTDDQIEALAQRLAKMIIREAA